MKQTRKSREAMIMGTTWCRWVIFLVASALLFSILMGSVAFGAVVPGGPGSAGQVENDAEEPEETRDPEEVLEEVLERIEAIFEKCLDTLSQAMEEAAEEAREALELAMSNVERAHDRFLERAIPPFGEDFFTDRPVPENRGGDEGDMEIPVTPQPPVEDDLPVTPPVGPFGE